MTRKQRRMMFVAVGMIMLAIATALVSFAFRDNIVFFHSPTEVKEKNFPPERRIRIGGLVEEGSIKREGKVVRFNVTDLANSVPVVYGGILPDLFRENQGVVTEGRLVEGVFQAAEVLAKHDEKYMPPEVTDALKKSGQWQGEPPATGAGKK